MTVTAIDQIIADYLARLNACLSEWPDPRRQQLIAEIGEHIAEGRAELPLETESAVRTLLDRVGRPEDIAAEALADETPIGARPSRSGILALLIVLVLVLIVGLGAWAIASHHTRPPKAASSSTSTSRPATTTSTPAKEPTVATCATALAGYYVPPVSWSYGGTISQDQGAGYGCQNQLMLVRAMQQIVNAHVTPTQQGEASGQYAVNSAGKIIVPNGFVIQLYQDVCNVVPTSTLCVNG